MALIEWGLPMSVEPVAIRQYHVFLASPGDVNDERQKVRHFFERYNRHTAQLWGVRFEVVGWENYATIGVGRPQELITAQTLERFRGSLALVIGIMAQRFGSAADRRAAAQAAITALDDSATVRIGGQHRLMIC